MTTASESVVYCEGYFDRAFLSGLLEHVGFQNPGRSKKPVFDPWGKLVTGGQYGFWSPSKAFIRVVPCGGRSAVLRQSRIRLRERATNHLDHLVISLDSDTEDFNGEIEKQIRESILQNAKQEFSEARLDGNNDIVIGEGESRTTVSLLVWRAKVPTGNGIPTKQTLERIACSAIVEIYPDRATEVQNWLDSRKNAPVAGPKEFAWSYMAGYYAERSCEAFYSGLGSDERIAGALRKRLEDIGAWRIIELLK